ncbi:MAG: hypothetical protein JWP02_2044 [Acidimicrobiales bacterium]|nr:hypothetical protein [Acidimicrobiales bacterium]
MLSGDPQRVRPLFMEILDYFKAIGRRFWVLVLVPAVAGVLPLAWFLVQPARYAAHATVIPTSLVGGVRSNQYRGSDADKSFASNVAATAKTNRIVDQVSGETKVPARKIRSGLTIKQVNTSAFVEMGYSTTKRIEAVPVVRAVATDTLRFLFQSQLDLARAQVDAGQKQVDQTENALNALSRKTGAESPEIAYNAIANGLPALQATVARAKNPAAAAQIQQQVNAREAQLAALGQDQGQYLALIDVRRRAVNLRRDAEQTEREASAQLAAADPGNALAIGKAHHSFPFSDVTQVAGGAAAGGVFLAVAYLFLGEVWAGVKRRPPRPAAVATG